MSEDATYVKFNTNRLKTLRKFTKVLHLMRLVGSLRPLIASTVGDTCSKRLGLIKWLSKLSVLKKKLHFLGLSAVSGLYKTERSLRTRLIFSSNVLLKITMSSRYARGSSNLTLIKITSIVRWNVSEAFLKPKGMGMKQYKP